MSRSLPRRLALLAAAVSLATAACAARGPSGAERRPQGAVNLQAARAALEAARKAGAPQKAAAAFIAAESQLATAEGLVSRGATGSGEAALKAEWMARAAGAEAACVGRVEALRLELQGGSDQELQRLQTRLRRSEEEQRRLEDRLAAQQRDLEVTEMELIRTKARLKGLETKAEASSAIAEARILLRRAEGRGGPLLALGQQSIAKAEQQLQQENYGAAIFFALKAQDLATRAQEGPDLRRAEPAALPLSVVVRVARANLRRGPGSDQPVVTLLPRGTRLAVKRAQGEWLEVTHDHTTGWIARSVVQ